MAASPGSGEAAHAEDHAFAVLPAPRQAATMRVAMSARVLIVDDQPAFREVARRLLDRRGYTVVGEAGDATAAVDVAGRLQPDAVLLDVRLGEQNGFAVAGALARACPGAAILLVSCDDFREHPEHVAASGACGFVLKSHLAVADLAACWRGEPAG